MLNLSHPTSHLPSEVLKKAEINIPPIFLLREALGGFRGPSALLKYQTTLWKMYRLI